MRLELPVPSKIVTWLLCQISITYLRIDFFHRFYLQLYYNVIFYYKMLYFSKSPFYYTAIFFSIWGKCKLLVSYIVTNMLLRPQTTDSRHVQGRKSKDNMNQLIKKLKCNILGGSWQSFLNINCPLIVLLSEQAFMFLFSTVNSLTKLSKNESWPGKFNILQHLVGLFNHVLQN